MWANTRRRIYQILEGPAPDDPVTRVCAFLLLSLICLNVIMVIVSSVPSIDAAYAPWFHAFEAFSITIFTVEYVLRVWSSREGPNGTQGAIGGRLRYMLTPLAVIDLVAILPFFLALFGVADMRFLRVLRLLRLLKLTRYSKSVTLLYEVIKEESRPIVAAIFILLLLLVFASSLAYLAEHKAQPDTFGSIPQAMWWAVITMTTVGYGDVTPVTLTGKFLASTIGIVGLGMVALPAGLLASGFTHKLHRQEKQFETLVDEVLRDGMITGAERARLIQAQAELDISEDRKSVV